MATKKPRSDFGENENGEALDEAAFLAEALERYDRGWQREEQNIKDAYEDLEFRAGNQWPPEAKKAREDPSAPRPCLTINLIPQFVRQVTGDMRIARPSMKVVGVDSRADKKTSEVLAGMLRYIENRSEAQYAYMVGADSQVTCGVGHWRVLHEYADQSTFNQEIAIQPVEDGVAVIWDPDDHTPTKEGAGFCFVPVDFTRAAFEKRWPDKTPSDVTGDHRYTWASQWLSEDTVRVAEYWEVRPDKKLLALNPDGSIDDLTGKDEAEIEAKKQSGARVEMREGRCVYRSLISLSDVLEPPVKWPGRYIPVVRAVGEEVRIGRRVVRHGVVRYAKDSQRAYNYARSTQTEVIALQPKSPFIGTDKNFKGHEGQWNSANSKAFPYLTYTPDPKNNGEPPQRSSPAVQLNGVDEMMIVSNQEMKATIGLFEASLGEASNEKSGVAIRERQREGDVGTFVYVDNFSRALRHTGRIVIDLIPHIYDTERVIRVVGEDGKVDVAEINKSVREGEQDVTYNDVTVGAYDVVMDSGPSYTTRREEAREGMAAFMQASPETGPLLLDLYAEAQNWPLADKIAKRARTLLPPHIQALEQAEENGEPPPPPPEPQPDPEMVKAQAQLEIKAKEVEANIQLRQMEFAAEQEMQLAKINAEFELRMTQLRAENALKREQMQFEHNLKLELAQFEASLKAETAGREADRKDAVAARDQARRDAGNGEARA